MATVYGSDTACLTDLPLISQQVTDPRVLIGQRISRLLQIPRGALGLIGGNPDRGFDTRTLVNRKLAPGDIATAQSQIQAECLKDEQVSAADVRITNTGGAVTISIQLTSSVGPFSLTLNVSQLTVDAVFGGAL